MVNVESSGNTIGMNGTYASYAMNKKNRDRYKIDEDGFIVLTFLGSCFTTSADLMDIGCICHHCGHRSRNIIPVWQENFRVFV